MRNLNLPLLLLLTLLSFSSCKKDKDATPKGEQLPTATMEGKNTFGAMVNGKVWVPKGRPNMYQPNLDVVYEPTHLGGWLNIVTYKGDDTEEYMYLFVTQLNHNGIYTLEDPEVAAAGFTSNCYYSAGDQNVYRTGKLEITKLDMQHGIIAGRFEFTLAKPGCDTIRVTEGRFDKKLF